MIYKYILWWYIDTYDYRDIYTQDEDDINIRWMILRHRPMMDR